MTVPARRTGPKARPRGGPLVMLVLLIGGWCGGRAVWWENVLDTQPASAAQATPLPEQLDHRVAIDWGPPPILIAAARAIAAEELRMMAQTGAPVAARAAWAVSPRSAPARVALQPAPPAHLAALDGSPRWEMEAGKTAALSGQRGSDRGPGSAPFLSPSRPVPVVPPPGRWSLDGWAFWRQGSSAAPVSQGRVPIYGASQTGAVLQYRLAPASRRDPRIYARAYRALVTRGENEGALGASLRPLGRVPVRIAGEVRYTDAAFFNAFRPAAYGVTEVPPLSLPYGLQAEVYAQGGWVGGPGATPFADGQASVTRDLPLVSRLTGDRLRLSLGAGAWGGAQKDAQRADIGPTLRLDTRIGKVPARIGLDWRLRVAGDAAPGSGVAVTVATGF